MPRGYSILKVFPERTDSVSLFNNVYMFYILSADEKYRLHIEHLSGVGTYIRTVVAVFDVWISHPCKATATRCWCRNTQPRITEMCKTILDYCGLVFMASPYLVNGCVHPYDALCWIFLPASFKMALRKSLRNVTNIRRIRSIRLLTHKRMPLNIYIFFLGGGGLIGKKWLILLSENRHLAYSVIFIHHILTH